MTKITSDANGLPGVRLGQSDHADGPSTPAPSHGGAAPRVGSVRMIKLARVVEMTGLGKTTIYELQKEGRFPMRVQLTSNSVRWVEEEVLAWLTQRTAEHRVGRKVS
jgi:prophage regulatory protein